MKTEFGFPRQGTGDEIDKEFSYLHTECGNYWYSTKKDPMLRNNCLCPKCGKVIKVVIVGVT